LDIALPLEFLVEFEQATGYINTPACVQSNEFSPSIHDRFKVEIVVGLADLVILFLVGAVLEFKL
jgi:hypothetical protein